MVTTAVSGPSSGAIDGSAAGTECAFMVSTT